MKLFKKAIFGAFKNSQGQLFRKEEVESFSRFKKFLFGEQIIVKRLSNDFPKTHIKPFSFQDNFEKGETQPKGYLNPFFI